MEDVHNIPNEEWKAERWMRVEAAMRQKIPAGAQVFVDLDSYRILEFHSVPRNRRKYKEDAADPILRILESPSCEAVDTGFSIPQFGAIA